MITCARIARYVLICLLPTPNTGSGRLPALVVKARTSAVAYPAVRLVKSDAARADSLAEDFTEPSDLAGLENDPQAMGRVMRKMGNQMGEELPPEFNEVVDRLEKGQSPESIEKDLPDVGADMPGMDDE